MSGRESSGDIAIKIDRPYGGRVKRAWLKRVVAETLAQENISHAEVSLVITSDGRIQELNRTYRHRDAPTDVIAFALREGSLFVPPPDGLLHLGEVVVSYPRAVQQAEEHGHATGQEVAILIIHGMLHLLGYDHETAGPEAKMRAREAEIRRHLREMGLC